MVIHLQVGLWAVNGCFLRPALAPEHFATMNYGQILLNSEVGLATVGSGRLGHQQFEGAVLVDLVDIAPVLRENRFEFGDHVVSEASGAEADSLAERTQAVFVNAVVALLEAGPTVLPEAHILISYDRLLTTFSGVGHVIVFLTSRKLSGGVVV